MPELVTLPVGYNLGSEFVIEDVLGSGGFGITYKARDTTLDLPVALKEYFPRSFAARNPDYSVRADEQSGQSDDDLERAYNRAAGHQSGIITVDEITAIQGRPSARDAPDGLFAWGLARFIQEAKVLARLESSGIVRVYRVFQANGTGYMSLELLQGDDLNALTKDGRAPRTQEQIDTLVRPLLDALDTVHAAGMLHRDICPRNIRIRARDGRPVLLDFGSAQPYSDEASVSVPILTPRYAPIEQYTRTKSGPWTDIYGLAATIHELLLGQPPSEAPDRVLDDTYQPLLGRVPQDGYRASFLRAVDWGLAVHPKDRPQNIAEWRKALLDSTTDRNKVFVSYRRSDTRQIAGRIHERLENEFGEDRLFFDVDSIPFGVDFRTHVAGAIDQSAVMIAIIGPAWLKQTSALDSWLPWRRKAEDFVEIEIQLALEKGVPILPLTIDDAPVPDPKSLPASLRNFVYLNACPVRSGRDFRVDIERVLATLREVLGQRDRGT